MTDDATAAVEADLDRLYGVRPEEFTALRKELASAAKRRGDAAGAKLIGAARRPTVAAWVVNALVRSDASAHLRLTELGDAMRTAHAEFDGLRIRELTAAQRKLVAELVRAGFAVTGLSAPTAALRDDVTGTLQAAVADPELAARLGRLTTAEQWSGFGDFATTAADFATREPVAEAARVAPDAVRAAEGRRDGAAARVDAAQAAHAGALQAVADGRGRAATARRRYETLLESLRAAEQAVDTADAELELAEEVARSASARVAEAKSELAQADSVLTSVRGESPP